jgi:hypothetical protein
MKHIKPFIAESRFESEEEWLDFLDDLNILGGGEFNEAVELKILNRILNRLDRDKVEVIYWSSGAEPKDWVQLTLPNEEWVLEELNKIGSNLEETIVAGWKPKLTEYEEWYGLTTLHYQIESKKLPQLGIKK